MGGIVHRIRIAAQIHPQHADYAGLRRAVLRAEELGYDIAYNWDHFFPLYGDRAGRHFESWSLLAAWAEATERIELGPLVACDGYRNPNLLADIARTVDHVSGGRVILGIGSGWFAKDFREYGYDFGTTGGRLQALAEHMPVIRSRLAALNPPPLRPMPILVAGTGEKRTLRIVAEHADSWHAGFPTHADEVASPVAALRRWCAELGRDPHEIEWGVGVEPDDLERFLREEADELVAIGFTQFTLGFNGPDHDVDAGAEWLAWRDARNG
jgi:probable F420-dependent oxidoreductase